jgi:Sulfocyanin (SoxE) domain
MLIGAITTMLGLAVACGGAAAPSTASPPTSPARTADVLSYNASAKTVSIKLIAGLGGDFNFNGFGNGKMGISVPVRWAVTVTCTNRSPAKHSCAIVADETAMDPVFPDASTPNPTIGLAQGESADFSLTPDRVGSFRIGCLVPGHQPSGMWDKFEVTATGLPSISPP